MNEAELRTRRHVRADSAMNAIEPEWLPDIAMDQRGAVGSVRVEQSGYIAVLARRRREFEAGRVL